MPSKFQTYDVRMKAIREVSSPARVHGELPLTDEAARTTLGTRAAIHEILGGRDDRLLVVIGPCSIHDPEAARDYAARLRGLRDRLGEDLLIVMRVYFEKPRTTVGWKGLINDPGLDDSFRIDDGLRLARKLLLDLNQTGVPAGTEFLDLITPQYVMDLVSWGAIGARTTESQVHREMASGLSCPVGFKNGTNGALGVAVDAVRAARVPHHFLSLTIHGRSAVFTTAGNEDCHLILRGGSKPNYDAKQVGIAAGSLEAAGLAPRLMIDFSHANSGKQAARQRDVAADVARQVSGGDRRIIGVMVESNIVAGRQDVVPGRKLVYGQSITDACLGWDESAVLLEELAAAARGRRSRPRAAAAS